MKKRLLAIILMVCMVIGTVGQNFLAVAQGEPVARSLASLQDETDDDQTDNTNEEKKDGKVGDNPDAKDANGKGLEKKITTSDGATYDIEVSYNADAGIPMDGVELLVSEILPGDDGYDFYIGETAKKLGTDADSVGLKRVFDISIVDAKDPAIIYEPAGNVNITISLVDGSLDEYESVGVLHFEEKKTKKSRSAETFSADAYNVDEVESKVNGESVKFTADSLEVYVITETLQKIIETGDGKTYKITVEYNTESGIPSGAELAVSEVPDDEFAGYLSQATKALGADIHSVSYGKLFDISIIKDGVEYQPDSKVTVTVELMDTDTVSDVQVVHFDDMDAAKLDASTDGTTVTFETDGFSVFSFVDFSVVDSEIEADIEEIEGVLYENDDIILTGKMPAGGIVEANRVDVSVDDKEALVAYDIKIYANATMKELGINWQPSDGAIQVMVKSDALAGKKNLKVYHMADSNAKPELVASVSAVDSGVSFSAESFSIYPIVDDGETGDNARIGYRFWYPNSNGTYVEIVTQWFRKSDVNEGGMRLYVPNIPGMTVEEVAAIFDGWHKGSGTGSSLVIQDDEVVINAVTTPETRTVLNDELVARAESADPFVEGDIVDIYAKFKTAYYITYVDVNPTYVLSTDLVLKQEGTTYFTVVDEVKPLSYSEKLLGWRELKSDNTLGDTFYTTDTTNPSYQASYPIDHNITLVPEIEGGYWLIYDDNDWVWDEAQQKYISGGATYTPAEFYMSFGEDARKPQRPEDPHRSGYEFEGWFTEAECNNEFVFNSDFLTSNTTVYAKWTPSDTTLRVVYWKQAATANGEPIRYDYADSRLVELNPSTNRHVKTGDTYTLETRDTRVYGTNGYAGTNNEGGIYHDIDGTDKEYFSYNASKTDSSVVVAADGSTTLNVYYDREKITLNFYTYTYDYTYTETTTNIGTQYAFINGQWVQLIRENGEWKAPVMETTTTTVDIYKLVTSLTEGKDYLILSRNSAGNGEALGHNGASISEISVTVNSGRSETNNTVYVLADGLNNSIVWTVQSGFKFINSNYYIKGNGNTLSINTGNNNNSWTWNNNNLRYGNNGYYLRYRNNNFTLRNSSSSGNAIYFYEKDTMTLTEVTSTGEYETYIGTRYTRSNSRNNGWHLYKQFIGLFDTSLEENGFSWPSEYWWYETGSSYSNSVSGMRTTFMAAFIPTTGTKEDFYGTTPSGSDFKYIRFYQQDLDDPNSYTLKETIETGSNGTFSISDKYTGFHAGSYSTNLGTTWTTLGEKDSNGYYATGVSYNNELHIRFDRNKYNLNFHKNSDSETVKTYHVSFGASLASYASEQPGQKEGWFVDVLEYEDDGITPKTYKWYTDQDYTQLYDFSGKMPAADVNVYCKWTGERIRALFVPGADNVNMNGQTLSFRVDYDEYISGTMFEAATRPGYILDGWHVGSPDGPVFHFATTPLKSSVEGVDMTYWYSPMWAATRHFYSDDDGVPSHESVHGIIEIYARWVLDKSKTGVQIVYDPGEAALTDSVGNLLTTVPIDTIFRAQSDTFTAREAPSNFNELYAFDYWEVIDESGNPVDTDNDGVPDQILPLSTGISIAKYYNHYFTKIFDEEAGTEIRRVIKLRAHYTKKEELVARYTTITYDGNTFEDNKYPSGTVTRQGYARDGSQRLAVTYDELINDTIILPNANDFFMDGYTLVGWSFIEGTYEEQIAQATADAPNFTPGQSVAADNMSKSELNDSENILYAMWQPKTYKVTVKQVVESGVPVNSFSYPWKTGVQSELDSYGVGTTLTGNNSFVVDTLSSDSSKNLEHWGRVGHAIKIQTPEIADTADYSVTVSAIVTWDDGTRHILEPVEGDIYQVLGDVEITYTYALKVEVHLSKFDMTDKTHAVTGAVFSLTPVRFDTTSQTWITVGTTVFTADMSSYATWNGRLQEGTYRIVETSVPDGYAAITEPLLLTVKRDADFQLRSLTGAAVDANLAELATHSGSTYKNELKIYDRPIYEIKVKKTVEGTNLETAYGFYAYLVLNGTPLKNYDTVGDGLAADTTDSSGYITFTLADGAEKSMMLPYGTIMTLTENDYSQFAVTVTSEEGVADTETENDRIYRCTVEKADTITFTNANRMLTVTKVVTDGYSNDGKAFDFTLGGLAPNKIYHFTVDETDFSQVADDLGDITFQLKADETMVIYLPANGTYTIEEADYTEEYYITSNSVDGGPVAEGRSVTLELEEDKLVTFTNDRPPVAPTGYNSNTLPFIIMLAVGLMLFAGLAFSKRRRKDED